MFPLHDFFNLLVSCMWKSGAWKSGIVYSLRMWKSGIVKSDSMEVWQSGSVDVRHFGLVLEGESLVV